MNSENIEKENVSKKLTPREWMQKYKTEIVISLSTTCIMAGIHFQNKGLIPYKFMTEKFLAHPELLKKLYLFNHSPFPQIMFFLIIPVISLFIMGIPLKDTGFRIGDWKKGLPYALLSILLLSPALYWASTMKDFTRYYEHRLQIGFLWLVFQYGLYMLAWEYILRGYIYFNLESKVGATLAIFLQSVPFAVAHIGKPAPEALTCFFGGLVLGYISCKSRSFLYAFLVHWGIYVTLLGFILLKTHKTAMLF